jgi:hypothetical protein
MAEPVAERLRSLRVGYSPYSSDMSKPGDRRRFGFYARTRQIPFELAKPGGSYDVVVLSAVADIMAWRRYPPETKIVYDLIDSYLALPRLDLRNFGRGIAKRLTGASSRITLDYRGAIEDMCRRADAVVCTTAEQRSDILRLCPNVHLVLDDHGSVVHDVKLDFRAGSPFKLVWEGLPHTLVGFAEVSGVIRDLSRRHEIEVHLVTDLEFRKYAGALGRRSTVRLASRFLDRFELHEWRADTLSKTITSCDLAVIPAPLDDPFMAGKPENKLLLFWRMGMPTVVSATPAYSRAMRAAGLGMACSTADEWRRTLERSISRESARRDGGRRGLTFVESEHRPAGLAAAWDRVFASIGI